MSLPARFLLLDAKLDAFLFAILGEEENGMPLSVASALARLGLDPWTEAGRLAALPPGRAVERLTSLIARIPLARTAPSDVRGIAASLVPLLSNGAARGSTPEGRPDAARWSRPSKLLLLLCLGLLAVALFGAIGSGGLLFDLLASPSHSQGRPP
jgi:hypothetical protein